MTCALEHHRREKIRKQMRQRRRALSNEQRQQAGEQIARHAMDFAPVRTAQNIAVFLAHDGEPDTSPLIARLWNEKKQLCMPVLHPFSRGQLLFLRYTPDTVLVSNRFGIPEPALDIRNLVPLNTLDLIFVPLVAFDNHGQRLGQGGGFYDRTLQNRSQYSLLPIGLAHDFQYIPTLPRATWMSRFQY